MRDITATINGCINHDHKLQKIVYEQFRGYALKIVFRYVHVYEKAVDVVNDGFVKFFNHIHKFERGEDDVENEKKLMGWLKRIMINTAIDELRKSNHLQETVTIPEEVWDLSDKNQDPDQAMFYKDLIILIKELPTPYRTVFNLYVIDGYNHSEISKMLMMSVGNTKSTLSRARSMLKDNLQNLENRKCRK